MPPSSDWKETALVASLGAAFGGLFMLQFSLLNSINNNNNNSNNNNRRKKNNNDDNGNDASGNRAYPYPASFLQNDRTRVPKDDDTMLRAHSKGWSMAEALAAAQNESAKAAAMDPAEILRSLQRGNSRFWSGLAQRPELSAFQRRALISTQFPSTAVLGCADSRVPVEIVFDQGLGDMFVVRVAGNCLGESTEASLEYAVLKLNVKVLLVMGHEGCGAIKAACLPLDKIEQEPEALANVLKSIKSGLDQDHLECIVDARARDREAVATNVKNQVIKLTEDPQIIAKVNEGKLKIVGAFYEISSGIVDFYMQVAKFDPNLGKPFEPSPGVQSRYNYETKEVVYA